METARLSSKGQVVLPKSVRSALKLAPGVEFAVERVGAGVLLRPLKPVKTTRLAEVIGSAGYRGRLKTLTDMDAAIAGAAKRHK
ncbi:MAG: AbrB/MazE/SpoVT family DNA-binding domain-containing protein [Gammaproteobacteria bacterium]